MKNSKHIIIDGRIRRSSTGRYTDRLVEYLQDLESPHRYTILVKPGDPWKMRAKNFKTVESAFPQFSLNILNDFKFTKQLKSLNPDLVHFTMTQQPLTYRGDRVTTTHDLTMLRFVRAGKTPLPLFWLKKLGYRLLFYVSHKKSNKIIVPSKFVKQDLIERQPFTKDKIEVTYESGEPPLKLKATQPKSIKQPFIMHVGSPFPHKNLYHLVRTFEELKKDYPKLELVLAGKKEFYFNELEEWAKKRSSYKSIHFTGFIEDSELKWLYENAEAYVLPALSEGFGLPGLEAMSHGCPVASSNQTCLPEVYGDAAAYFDPTNLNDTVRAVKPILDDPKLRKKLIDNGYKRLKQFSWKKMSEETLDIYNQVLRK